MRQAVLRQAVDDVFNQWSAGYWVPATGVLVETLLDRADDADLRDAEALIDRLRSVPTAHETERPL